MTLPSQCSGSPGELWGLGESSGWAVDTRGELVLRPRTQWVLGTSCGLRLRLWHPSSPGGGPGFAIPRLRGLGPGTGLRLFPPL